MQFNYIKCKFRLNNFFECNLCVNLYINNLKHYNISLLLEIHCKKLLYNLQKLTGNFGCQ